MERIGNEIERGLARVGGGEGLSLAELTSRWPVVVGEQIARNAWPLRMGKDGTLHVATSSATWAFELDQMRTEIVARLKEAVGESAPKELRFRPGPLPEPAAPPPASSPERSPEPTPEVRRTAASAAAAIEDPELRLTVEKAARASLSKGRSDRGFW
jgi:hypothetical protein